MSLALNNQNMAKYIQYDGSLTTPPCSEVVDWHVLTETRAISQSMYNAFVRGTGSFTADGNTIGNARTVQPLGTRQPTGCDWSANGERRQKAAFAKYKEREFPIMRAENKGLKKSQIDERIFKAWQKSDENPMKAGK